MRSARGQRYITLSRAKAERSNIPTFKSQAISTDDARPIDPRRFRTSLERFAIQLPNRFRTDGGDRHMAPSHLTGRPVRLR